MLIQNLQITSVHVNLEHGQKFNPGLVLISFWTTGPWVSRDYSDSINFFVFDFKHKEFLCTELGGLIDMLLIH